MDWHAASEPGVLEKTLFLVDYELLGQNVTGLDLVEGLSIERRSVLVTSRFDEEGIRGRCDKIGLKLIPKGMAGLVPIYVQ